MKTAPRKDVDALNEMIEKSLVPNFDATKVPTTELVPWTDLLSYYFNHPDSVEKEPMKNLPPERQVALHVPTPKLLPIPAKYDGLPPLPSPPIAWHRGGQTPAQYLSEAEVKSYFTQ